MTRMHGKAWPGYVAKHGQDAWTGGGHGMKMRCSMAQMRGVAQARDEGVSEVWVGGCAGKMQQGYETR